MLALKAAFHSPVCRPTPSTAKPGPPPFPLRAPTQVNALVNLGNHSHPHSQKDLSRYKAVLIACKAKNVAVKA